MKCTACLQGTPWECTKRGKCEDDVVLSVDDGSIASVVANFNDSVAAGSSNEASNEVDPDGIDDSEEPHLRTYKDDSALRDQQSTGRKRAARAYPMNEHAPCEWSMKKNCGGGDFPIVGCLNGKQQARHHGPDKNTLNNELGNVHRICHSCHNRWHTLNDDGYVWGNIYPLHDPKDCGIEDIAQNELFWDGRKVVKAKD